MPIPLKDGQRMLMAQVGKPYTFGYEVKLDDHDPLAFDCSELVQWFFHQFGHRVPDGSYNQFNESDQVVSPLPFDLGFWSGESGVYHVCIVLDDALVIHAKNSKAGVVTDPIYKFSGYRDFAGWRRPKCLLV